MKKRPEKNPKHIKALRTAAIIPGIATMLVVPAYATDPVAAINKLSDLLFLVLKGMGVILVGLGVMNVALSIQSHDPSQRAQGFLALVAGVLLCAVESICAYLGII